MLSYSASASFLARASSRRQIGRPLQVTLRQQIEERAGASPLQGSEGLFRAAGFDQSSEAIPVVLRGRSAESGPSFRRPAELLPLLIENLGGATKGLRGRRGAAGAAVDLAQVVQQHPQSRAARHDLLVDHQGAPQKLLGLRQVSALGSDNSQAPQGVRHLQRLRRGLLPLRKHAAVKLLGQRQISALQRDHGSLIARLRGAETPW